LGFVAADDEIEEIRARLAAIERRLGIVWTPEGVDPGTLSEEAGSSPNAPNTSSGAGRRSPGASRHPLPLEEGRASASQAPPPIPDHEQPTTNNGQRPSQMLETRIGAHWLNRVGIAAVLFGAAFFLKYAFDNNWIGPSMRVAIGAAVGIVLLTWGEAFRARGHELFAHSLDVLGAGILYLTIWAASQMYTLVSGAAAFGAMIFVTAIVVGLALRHRSQFLAGVALTGGFMTPILLSTGGDHETALFTYVALLDFAAVVLLVLHPWLRALAVAFFGTLVLYIGWAADHYEPAVMTRTIGFATLFFLLFAIVPLLRREFIPSAARDQRSTDDARVSGKVPPGASADLSLSLGIKLTILAFANAIVYFAQLSAMMNATPDRLAWYAVSLAALFLIIAAALKLRGIEREDLAAAHLALALGFITIAIPLKLNELWITVGWLAESAALLVIAPRLSRTRAQVFRLLGTIALVAGIFRLLFIDKFAPQHLLLNWRALTYAIAIGVLAAIAHPYRDSVWQIAVTAGNTLAVIALTLEANRIHADIARNFTRSAIWMAYGAALMIVGFQRHLAFLRWLALLLIGITVAKVFFFDINALERIYRILSFIGLGVILLAISFAYQRKWITLEDSAP
jgi:uncharacterized membrane protein